MAKKNRQSRSTSPGQPSLESSTTPLSDLEKLLIQVKHHLDNGQPNRALEAIRQSRVKSDWVSNAIGVCQLRSGDAATAVQTFRRLVISEGIHFRKDVPAVFVANFAAALYATGNLDGFLSTLQEIGNEQHPAVERYQEAYSRWRGSLTLWQKVKYVFAGKPSRPFNLDPLGDLG